MTQNDAKWNDTDEISNMSNHDTKWADWDQKSKLSAMCDKCIFWNFVTIKYSYVRIKIRETGGTCRGDSGGKIINLYMAKIDNCSLTSKLFKCFIIQHYIHNHKEFSQKNISNFLSTALHCWLCSYQKNISECAVKKGRSYISFKYENKDATCVHIMEAAF